MKTHIIAIIDESGSMGLKRNDVIAGFNRFIDDQSKQDGECSVSLVKFNTRSNVVYKDKDVCDVPDLTDQTYQPGGNTALYDAISDAVNIRVRGRCKTICLVMTDGEENSSRETTFSQVKQIMKTKEDSGSWTFVYLGVDPGDWARRTGMSAGNTQQFDPNNIMGAIATMSLGVSQLRSSNKSATLEFYNQDKVH